MINIQGLSKTYLTARGRLSVLQDVHADLARGTFAAVIGPSGCGKSTLLLILGALLHPDTGSVRVAGEDLLAMPAEQRAQRRAELVGFVFQRFHLLPYLTVEDNIRAASVPRGMKEPEGRTRELMETFHLQHRRQHIPAQLSVGEQQRAALARALYNRPAVLLADEPTGNLDPENADVVLQAFVDFAAHCGTVLMVTHSTQAASLATQRWHLREGRLETA